MWQDVNVPRKVDHRQRRTLIADAMMRVAAERGLEEMSLRHVAAEAGVTSGMVQHYFRNKDEMVTFAMQKVKESISTRIADDGPGEDATAAELVRAWLVQLLPLDEVRRTEGRVALAFMAYAVSRPDVGAAVRADNAFLRKVITERIHDAQQAGEVPSHHDPEDTATALMALVEGLSIHALNGDLSPERALAVFDLQLGQLFTSDAAK